MPNIFELFFVLGAALAMTAVTVGPFYLLFVALPNAAKAAERKERDEQLAREAAEKQAETEAFATKITALE
jgi:hypothetical protein